MAYTNTNSSINNSGLPSVADANKYFYLPALGYYNFGQLKNVGDDGWYWSSSADVWDSDRAYNLDFGSGVVDVNNYNRYNGFRAEALQ